MKKLYLVLPLIVILLAACSKKDYIVDDISESEWMRTHDHGIVAHVDHTNGNYIVETYHGYSVVELWGGIRPVEYDDEYANFDNRGIQTIYNHSGNYFTKGRIVESWLNWQDARFILDELRYGNY